ncbi:energy-coupling factor transporter transmembrane component T [Methanobrevibacter olleyae]|uniref:Cobalt ABC transporter permease protein CbiQ n=1 Tax=Methanobrevibacter olleyae TaxID=294671 RepID=A0A126QZB7_METOL|nr:energy-coupling factor transporter transmembrane component T [Methanobrevibacter olleyae]AMK15164.1 cobalt ABC transporter permease protein CbiQ [Methanobrevibacter olleyae]SFL45779.1 energy-coupling factor transport system permease protein [Methanobrevibacter olleyae]
MELTSIHPGVYLIYYFIMVLFAFIFSDPYFVLTFLVLMIILISLQGISSELKNMMKFFIPLSILIIILNPLLNRTGFHKIYLGSNFFLTYEAIAYGILMSLALFIVILVFASYNRSVSYQEMLYIFSKKLPIISMIILMALRFIPLINSRAIEVQKLNSLKNNGIEFDGDDYELGENDEKGNDLEKIDLDKFNSNFNTNYNSKLINKLKSNKRISSIIKEAKTLGRIMGITVSWSLEESMFTAKSMKARAYNVTERTSYLSYRFSNADYLFLLIIIVTVSIIIVGLIQGVGMINIYPSIDFSFSNLPFNIYYLSFVVFLLPLIYLEIKERILYGINF